MAQRGIQIRHQHEFCRRRSDHRGRDQQTRQNSEQNAAAHKQACIILRQGFGRRAAFSVHKKEQQRQHQHEADGQDDRLLLPVLRMEEKHAEKQQGRSGRRKQGAQHLARVLEFVEQVLQQGEDVVERPIQHEAGWRIIQQHQKQQRHEIELQLVLEREALRIDGAGDEVHSRHQDRQRVERQTVDRQESVRRAKVGNGAKGHAAQLGEIGQEMIGRNKKRDLKRQRQRASEGINRLVVVLAVIGLQHHEALVAAEGLFDMVDPGSKLFLRRALLRLDRIRAAIERQQKGVERQAQGKDRQAAVIQNQIRQRIDQLENQFKRPDQQLV